MGRGRIGLHEARDLEAVAAGEEHVADDRIGPVAPHQVEPLVAVGRQPHVEARRLQPRRQQAADARVVVDDEHARRAARARLGHAPADRASITRTVSAKARMSMGLHTYASHPASSPRWRSDGMA